MDNATKQRIQELISRNEKIGIAVGKGPTIDTMGGALALYLALISLRKKVTVACVEEPTVAISSLVGIDKVRTTLDGESADLVVSFPYREGEIEKVSYTIEEGNLNIVVKAADTGLSFSEKDVQYRRNGGVPTLLFIVGTPRLSDLGSLFDATELKDTTVVNIDNTSQNQGFGDVTFVSSQFSSVCEQVASLLSSLAIPIDTDIAQNLLYGITFATDNFQKPTTSYLAFETAGKLMQKGALRQSPAVASAPHAVPDALFEEDFLDDFSRDRKHHQQEKQMGKGKKPPSDWLVPRVYKGSTEV